MLNHDSKTTTKPAVARRVFRDRWSFGQRQKLLGSFGATTFGDLSRFGDRSVRVDRLTLTQGTTVGMVYRYALPETNSKFAPEN